MTSKEKLLKIWQHKNYNTMTGPRFRSSIATDFECTSKAVFQWMLPDARPDSRKPDKYHTMLIDKKFRKLRLDKEQADE